jgi:pSer/pThr/pTyr-binding forkhead associated (FHA) protein
MLSFSNGQLVVEDLNSANGTFVNNERIAGKRVVLPGDHLTIGPLMFAVEYSLGNANEESEPDVELVDAPAAASNAPIPFKDQDAEQHEAAEVIFDDSESLHLPEGGDLRDFLGKMDR